MGTFKYNTKLKYLILTLNRITNFDFDLVHLQSLIYFDLNINLLTSLEEHAFYSIAYGNRSKVEIYVVIISLVIAHIIGYSNQSIIKECR